MSDGADHRIELPLPRVQGSNARSHWSVRSRTAKSDRYVAFGTARSLVPRKPLSNPHVVIDWHCPTKRLIDCDNALSRCKSYLDGLTDAGWWADDRADRPVISPPPGCADAVGDCRDPGIGV